MSLVVIGSIAFDAVKSPFGEREKMLGGAAVHFSLAASFFTDVRVVGPVGDDFGESEYAVLHGRGVNTDDIEHVEGGKTFFWKGHYDFDLNQAHTDDTQLGRVRRVRAEAVGDLEERRPPVPREHPAGRAARRARADAWARSGSASTR